MELNQEELKNILTIFEKMGMAPKIDSTSDFKTWLSDMSKQEGSFQGPDVKPPPPLASAKEEQTPTASFHYFPKIPFFSGEVCKDTPYDLWRFEADCLLQSKTYPHDVILQAIRKSLKGEAALIAMKLGRNATVEILLTKMKSAFGTLRRRATLMSDFYSCSQREDEDVTAWGCRLENMLYQITEHRSIPEDEQDEMLRTRMWDGLKPGLKGVAAHKFDAITNFDDLRLCLREIEFDLRRDKSAAPVKKQSASAKMVNTLNPSSAASTKEEVTNLKAMMEEIRREISELKEQSQVQAQVNQQQIYNSPYSTQRSHNKRDRHPGNVSKPQVEDAYPRRPLPA
ncbi:uncharacterized protein LOC124276252 [Haliotis rubra]|uniref:uncharacterized protein LOC124276252 n=1 Tax=Haliotis rubra TaxID=36100 RepID=UPI001EE5A2A4|nr:uncharacterized protein LOC124276252 [Haliotis rubra]